MYFLKCSNTDEVIMLASEKARNSFLKQLEVTYAGEGMDIESWHGLKEGMEKTIKTLLLLTDKTKQG